MVKRSYRRKGLQQGICLREREIDSLFKNQMVKPGTILAQNDEPLKWTNGPYPIQIHANFQILMGHL